MGVLTEEEYAYVRELKQKGIFQKFNAEDLRGITRNGGVALMCSDGDIDAFNHHVRISHRPHCVKVFGGPLILSPSFKGYDAVRTVLFMENMRWGMEAKKTGSLFLYFHYPCGVAMKFGHTLREVIRLAPEVIGVLTAADFNPKKIGLFFHVKRINRGGEEEQNTYLFNS